MSSYPSSGHGSGNSYSPAEMFWMVSISLSPRNGDMPVSLENERRKGGGRKGGGLRRQRIREQRIVREGEGGGRREKRWKYGERERQPENEKKKRCRQRERIGLRGVWRMKEEWCERVTREERGRECGIRGNEEQMWTVEGDWMRGMIGGVGNLISSLRYCVWVINEDTYTNRKQRLECWQETWENELCTHTHCYTYIT